MSRITVDSSLRERLQGFREVNNFVDENGEALGSFVPADVRLKELYALAHAQITDEEIEELRHEEGPEYSLLEILRELEGK
jgi:hypothetical protein